MPWLHMSVILLFVLFFATGVMTFKFRLFDKIFFFIEEETLKFETYVITAFVILLGLLLIDKIFNSHDSLSTSLLTGFGSLLAVFMSLYIHDRSNYEYRKRKLIETLPKWVMPKPYRTIMLLPTNGEKTYSDSIRFFYFVLSTNNSNRSVSPLIQRAFPSLNQGKDDRNFFGQNAVAFPNKIYHLGIPRVVRRKKNDGSEVIIVCANSSSDKQTFMIEGGNVKGHFYLSNNHLIPYGLTPDIRNDKGKINNQIKIAESYCRLFKLF